MFFLAFSSVIVVLVQKPGGINRNDVVSDEDKQYHSSQNSRKRVFFWGAGILFNLV